MGLAPLIAITGRLRDEVDGLTFASPVSAVYNPLGYAWDAHVEYLGRFGSGEGRVVLLGMNPGPWGMVQTGVPFGEVGAVRDWMGIRAPIGRPLREHPRRPVDGWGCVRSEVSGRRLWGWAAARFGSPEAFFARFFIVNWCPLAFLEESGRNRTPDKLPAAERRALEAVCDRALADLLAVLRPTRVVGVGGFAEHRAGVACPDLPRGRILHPSPASPTANLGWAEAAERELRAQGIAIP